MDISIWAKDYGLNIHELHSEVILEIEPHIKVDPIALEEFQKHYDVLCRPQVLTVIEKAVIRDTIGLVQLPDGQICYQGNWWLPYLQNHPAYRRRFPKQRRKIAGNVYSLLCLWGDEFYHWFHDVLPRLEFALPHLPADTKFLIQDQPSSYQLDSLQAYGIGQNQLEVQLVGMDTQVERLWFATPIGHTSLGSGSALRSVANRLTKFFQTDHSQANPSRIYVSRQKAKMRRVVNEQELKPILHDYGFTVYTLEDLSLKEQVNLFAHADAIAGPHGAGLMNMIYAPDKASVAEISTSPTVPCYIVMARQLQHPFTRIQAVTVGNTATSDMSVTPLKLEAYFKQQLPG